MRRLAVLGALFVMIGIMLVPTLRAFLSQREENAALAADLDARRARLEALQQELQAWQDPAYVEAQARRRFGFVHPGETAYRVIVPDGYEGATGHGAVGVPRSDSELTPYYTLLLGSLRSIDQPADAAADQRDEVPISPELSTSPTPSAGPTPSASSTPSAKPTASSTPRSASPSSSR